MENINITKVWITDKEVWIRTSEGKEACERFDNYPRLRFATPEQRKNFTLSNDGIHWSEINEDLSFDGFFTEKPSNPLYELFISHPELNASFIARRMGIPQSIFAQYISGTKKPSKEHSEEILQTIREIGRGLAVV